MTQDRSGFGERKNTSTDSEVWVSATSVNQSSHSDHRTGRSPIQLMAW